jgi:hypothetical protein
VPRLPRAVLDNANSAFAHGVSIAAIVAAGLLTACSIACLVLLREATPATSEAGEPHLDPAAAAA